VHVPPKQYRAAPHWPAAEQVGSQIASGVHWKPDGQGAPVVHACLQRPIGCPCTSSVWQSAGLVQSALHRQMPPAADGIAAPMHAGGPLSSFMITRASGMSIAGGLLHPKTSVTWASTHMRTSLSSSIGSLRQRMGSRSRGE
jgi:hypothetical protein